MGIICGDPGQLRALNLDGHINLIDFCYEFDVVNMSYMKLLLDWTTSIAITYENYVLLFMKISRLCVIKNKRYLHPIQSKIKMC
jgi:hypothetical protein